MNFEVIDPDKVEGPINVVPLVWDDEKSHKLVADWGEDPCWCEPLIEGKYVHHRNIFDAIDRTSLIS